MLFLQDKYMLFNKIDKFRVNCFRYDKQSNIRDHNKATIYLNESTPFLEDLIFFLITSHYSINKEKYHGFITNLFKYQWKNYNDS